MNPFQKVLIAYDGSANAKVALGFALEGDTANRVADKANCSVFILKAVAEISKPNTLQNHHE